uniref:Uncharacterized protein n=1 Tax=Cacopsylla melanoneura TaxID=428564 RepID=A0A8D8S9M5_9HEMI
MIERLVEGNVIGKLEQGRKLFHHEISSVPYEGRGVLKRGLVGGGETGLQFGYVVVLQLPKRVDYFRIFLQGQWSDVQFHDSVNGGQGRPEIRLCHGKASSQNGLLVQQFGFDFQKGQSGFSFSLEHCLVLGSQLGHD